MMKTYNVFLDSNNIISTVLAPTPSLVIGSKICQVSIFHLYRPLTLYEVKFLKSDS